MESDAGPQLPVSRTHDLVGVREPEGHEEQTGLVDVRIVAVDDVDLRLVAVEVPAEPVRDHSSTGAAPEDDDPLLAHSCLLGHSQPQRHGSPQHRGRR